MKKLIICILFFCSYNMFAQTLKFEIPARTYKIIVRDTLSTEDNFEMVGRTLSENGFTIEAKDKEFYTIKSGNQEFGSGNTYFMNFALKKNEIIITGQFKINLTLQMYGVRSVDEFNKIIYTSGYPKKAFLKMNEFALKLGSFLEYYGE